MPRRIDIELTSSLADGSWTWRAAGARNPKGVVESAILPDGSKVGDELKVEVEQGLDGIDILSVIRGRDTGARDLLELLPAEENFQAVIETRAKRDRNDRGDRGGRDGKRGGGRDGKGRDNKGRDGDSRGRGDDRGDGGNNRGPRRPHFEAPPELPKRPKPKRLRPGKDHRNAVLASIAEEQRGIAELALQGMPAVRTRLAEDNKKLTAEGKPTMPEASVLKMAEDMLPKLRVADWLDRAEAAQKQMEHLDLRDIRSVVAAGDDPVVARDDSTKAINDQLKKDLAKKQDVELKLWLEDVDAALEVGRSIRALRLSSQPPKAGVMFPPELARKLGEAATAGLTADDTSDRWSAVMEAAAFSPVRTLVTPAAPPSPITDDLKKTARRLGPLLPQIAALLGVDVPADAPRPKPLRPTYGKDKKKSAARRDDGRPSRERDDGRQGRGPREERSDRAPNGEPRREKAKRKPDDETAAATDDAVIDAAAATDETVVATDAVTSNKPVEQSAAEAPVTDTPTEAPAAEAPVTDTPTEAPAAEAPVTDTPTEAPASDTAPVDEPAAAAIAEAAPAADASTDNA